MHAVIGKVWLCVIVLKALLNWLVSIQTESLNWETRNSPSSRITQGVTVQVFHLGAPIGLSNSRSFHRVFTEPTSILTSKPS